MLIKYVLKVNKNKNTVKRERKTFDDLYPVYVCYMQYTCIIII